jgi:hypothetical protein
LEIKILAGTASLVDCKPMARGPPVVGFSMGERGRPVPLGEIQHKKRKDQNESLREDRSF